MSENTIKKDLLAIPEVYKVEQITDTKYKILVDECARLIHLYKVFKAIGAVLFIFTELNNGDNFWIELEVGE